MVANVAESGQYAQIGRELGTLTGGRPVEGPGEVGAMAFHSDVAVLDFLSHPARTDALLARERDLAGPVRRTVTDLSAVWRRPAPMMPLRWALVFADHPGASVPMAQCRSKLQNADMSGAITVRDVPDEVRAELAARAARSGRSLQEYLRGELIELAARPSMESVMERVRARKDATGTLLSAETIVGARDADRR